MLEPMICQRAFNTPLLMHPAKAAAAIAGLGQRLVGGGVELRHAPAPVEHTAFENGRPSMGKLGDRLGRAFDADNISPFPVLENVAVIGIEGTLAHKGGWVGKSSGVTSYEGLQTQIRRAAARDDVRGVLFEVDSFGGEAAGAFETADMIRALSEIKPTIAILTDFALSAGYMLAAQARQVVAPEFGRAGSIGVITMHVDWSAHLAQEGIAVTLLYSGRHKADGNPFEALPKPMAEAIRAELAVMRDRFAESVAAGRGARFPVKAALDTEAADFRAGEATALGMIDAVGDTNAAFDAFVAAVNRS